MITIPILSRHEQPIRKINMRMVLVLIQSAYAVPEMLFLFDMFCPYT